MTVVPISLKDANAFVEKYHRHHKPVLRCKWQIGAMKNDNLVGVCMVGRPVARVFDHTKVIEVTRLCTDGTKNACSFLYGAADRIAKEMGYKQIQTYILESEFGSSLKASNWKDMYTVRGRQWKYYKKTKINDLFGETVIGSNPERRTDQPTCNKRFYVKEL